mmetsp:Transcript_7806/g.13905  ORF Transcript_7806/g.13905 Transcript_7806/m.13905 type:complete len:277 (-) Transcript_7806:29-859(-)
MKVKKATRGSQTSFSALATSFVMTAWQYSSGSPASRSIWIRSQQEIGVSSAGLTITGQPVAMAGMAWCTMRLSGWLNALTATTTPTGSCLVIAMRPMEAALRFMGISFPAWVRSVSMMTLIPSIALATSTLESSSGLPPSVAALSARSSALASIILHRFLRISTRLGIDSQRSRSWNSSYAAWREASMAAPSEEGMLAMCAPSNGADTETSPSLDWAPFTVSRGSFMLSRGADVRYAATRRQLVRPGAARRSTRDIDMAKKNRHSERDQKQNWTQK